MARFDKLEIQSDSDGNDDDVRVVRDDCDWLAQADRQRRVGHYESALRLYSRALEDDKALVAGWLGQVQMLVQLEEYPEAELWARKALELFPNNGELLAGRAQAVVRLGDHKQAMLLSDGAIKQSGQSAYRWMVRGEVQLAVQQTADEHCFAKALQVDRDWLVPLESALINLHYGAASKGLRLALQAAEAASDQHYVWLIVGRCQTELGFNANAIKSFNRCLELNPGHVDAQRALGEVSQRGWSLKGFVRGLFSKD